MARIRDLLRGAGLDPLDAEVILAHVLRKPRPWILAHGDDDVPSDLAAEVQTLKDRRRLGEPLAYLTGEKEFYGRLFAVDPRVMIPRPATEGLVEEVCSIARDRDRDRVRVRRVDRGVVALTVLKQHVASRRAPFAVLDIGTGSGCIAVTLALELPSVPVVASDVSAHALDVARRNADRHGVLDRITFLRACGIPETDDREFLLVSNPPYLRAGIDDDTCLADEPREALFAGSDGLGVLLPLARAAAAHPRCIGVVLECREDQVAAVREALGNVRGSGAGPRAPGRSGRGRGGRRRIARAAAARRSPRARGGRGASRPS